MLGLERGRGSGGIPLGLARATGFSLIRKWIKWRLRPPGRSARPWTASRLWTDPSGSKAEPFPVMSLPGCPPRPRRLRKGWLCLIASKRSSEPRPTGWQDGLMRAGSRQKLQRTGAAGHGLRRSSYPCSSRGQASAPPALPCFTPWGNFNGVWLRSGSLSLVLILGLVLIDVALHRSHRSQQDEGRRRVLRLAAYRQTLQDIGRLGERARARPRPGGEEEGHAREEVDGDV